MDAMSDLLKSSHGELAEALSELRTEHDVTLERLKEVYMGQGINLYNIDFYPQHFLPAYHVFGNWKQSFSFDFLPYIWGNWWNKYIAIFYGRVIRSHRRYFCINRSLGWRGVSGALHITVRCRSQSSVKSRFSCFKFPPVVFLLGSCLLPFLWLDQSLLFSTFLIPNLLFT